LDATAWFDRWWDEGAGMVGYPSVVGSPTNPYQRPGVPLVRETATYAVALLERGRQGDAERAARALESVLAHQIDDSRSVAHGTWRRSPLEPFPGDAPREWIDYDPNWREFVGSALALALHHEARLPPPTVAAIDAALRLAVEGTLARQLSAEYTNIALMSTFLLDYAGDRLGETAWQRAGETLASEIDQGYRRTGAFPEHNSPTYYGVDLYGLALWRARAPSERLRARGASLEEAFWRDLARFYHPGLRNLCGPYSRAYGMDMTRYVAALGCWIAPVVPSDRAPLPALGDAVPHAHDLFGLPLVGALETRPPEDVQRALLALPGEQSIEQTIAEHPRRVATARLHAGAMWGGEDTSGRIVHWQHHPATLHWRRPDNAVGWLRVVTTAPVDATATPTGLDVRVHTGLSWLRDADIPMGLEFDPESGPQLERSGEIFTLPGLRLRVRASLDLPWKRDLPWPRHGMPVTSEHIGLCLAAGTAPSAVELGIEVLELPD